jgi:hypothetical protein
MTFWDETGKRGNLVTDVATRDGEGYSVDAREQTRGIRTDIIEFAAGETVVIASEIAGPHASRGGGSREGQCACQTRGALERAVFMFGQGLRTRKMQFWKLLENMWKKTCLLDVMCVHKIFFVSRCPRDHRRGTRYEM